jgi:hypothetical protein
MLIRFLVAVLVIALLTAAYFWLALQWSYSSGERAGWVQKFSHKGWVCKTWEGELALVSLPGSSVEKFLFTVRDDAVAKEVSAATGKRVTLHYEEKVGLPTTCFGETRHFVTKVTAASDIPIGPGVVVPTPIQPSTPSAPPSAPAAATAPPAPAASR